MHVCTEPLVDVAGAQWPFIYQAATTIKSMCQLRSSIGQLLRQRAAILFTAENPRHCHGVKLKITNPEV